MGFFSSNKGGGGGGTQVVHHEEAHHTKSRWFSSKPKHATPPPSIPTKPPPLPPQHYTLQPTLSLKPATTPFHHSYQTRPSAPPFPSVPPTPSTRFNHPPPSLLVQSSSSKKPPSLFSERESAYQGSALASGSKGGGGLALGFADDQRSTTSRKRGKAREDVSTSTLATRLNELALANADGLLGDDEYRVLRQTMFEQVANSQSAPTASRYGQVPRVETSDDRMSERDNARTPTARMYNGPHSTSRPSSTHSSSSSHSKLSAIGSFFRKKPSHHSLHDSQSRSSSSRRESSSLFSSNSSSNPGRASTSSGSLLQVPGDHNRESRFGSINTINPSIRSGRTSRTALTDATFEGSRPSSLFSMSSKASASAPPSAFHLRALHSTSSDAGGAEALPGAEATPAEVRTEIASVEAEGRRLVAAFDGLEEAAFRDAEGGFGPGDDARGGGGGDDWTVVSNPLPSPLHPHKPQPTPLKPALKNPASASSAGRRTSIASSFSPPSHSHSSSMASPSSFLLNSSTSSPPSTLSRKLSRITPSTSSTTTSTSTNPFSTSTSTSTGTSLLSRSTSSATTRGGRASVDRALPSLPRATADDPEAAALEATVLDLRRRKTDTKERYQRRLEFLKGKLRAAELKERAMR